MIEIRAMRDADAAGMHELHTKAVRQVCATLLESDVVEAWLYGRTPEGYLRAANDGGESFWVALADTDRIAGFASWRDNELMSLFVDPDSQGLGLGRRLFQACEEDAARKGAVITRLISTLNAQTFYETRGFQAGQRGYVEKRNMRIPHIEMRRV